MNRILINKIQSTDGDWWECYCDKYGRSSCHGVGYSPEESLINFLYELKIFEDLLNKRDKVSFTIKDLKHGDKVFFKNGKIGSVFVNQDLKITTYEGLYFNSFDYDEYFCAREDVFKEFDIMIIRRKNKDGGYDVVWERKK